MIRVRIHPTTSQGTSNMETRSTDAKGRLSLPKAFANATVIIDQLSET
jgi:hypothetical protein